MHSMEQEAASTAALVVALSRSDASYIQDLLLLPGAPCNTVQVHATYTRYSMYILHTLEVPPYTTGRCAPVLQLKANIPSVLPILVSCEVATVGLI